MKIIINSIEKHFNEKEEYEKSMLKKTKNLKLKEILKEKDLEKRKELVENSGLNINLKSYFNENYHCEIYKENIKINKNDNYFKFYKHLNINEKDISLDFFKNILEKEEKGTVLIVTCMFGTLLDVRECFLELEKDD